MNAVTITSDFLSLSCLRLCYGSTVTWSREQNTFNGNLPFPHAFARDSAWLYSFFFFPPAKASSVATAADATSIIATAATIAKVMYVFMLLFRTKVKTISAAKIQSSGLILEILVIAGSNFVA